MSLNYQYELVARLERELADLQKKVSDETKKELDKQKQIDSVNRSISSSTSASALQSKQGQIQGYQSELIRIQSTKSDIQRKISDKTSELTRKKQDLQKEEAKEREKQKKEQEKFQKEQMEFQRKQEAYWQEQESYQREQEDLQRKLQNDIANQKGILNTLVQQIHTANVNNENIEIKEHDFFISHAHEDKESFVRPLADLLIKNGHNVWLDELKMQVGDSLRKKIDEGLKSSKYGIVVLSRDFFKKNWPEYELNGLVAKEMNGVKVILPIWHNVTRDEVLSFSPTLADKLALNTAIHSVAEIATELGKLL